MMVNLLLVGKKDFLGLLDLDLDLAIITVMKRMSRKSSIYGRSLRELGVRSRFIINVFTCLLTPFVDVHYCNFTDMNVRHYFRHL